MILLRQMTHLSRVETRHFSNWYNQNIAPDILLVEPKVVCTCKMHLVEFAFSGVAALIKAWIIFMARSTFAPVSRRLWKKREMCTTGSRRAVLSLRCRICTLSSLFRGIWDAPPDTACLSFFRSCSHRLALCVAVPRYAWRLETRCPPRCKCEARCPTAICIDISRDAANKREINIYFY